MTLTRCPFFFSFLILFIIFNIKKGATQPFQKGWKSLKIAIFRDNFENAMF